MLDILEWAMFDAVSFKEKQQACKGLLFSRPHVSPTNSQEPTLRFAGESLARNLSFPDFDLDYDDLGGTLRWLAPDDASQADRLFGRKLRP